VKEEVVESIELPPAPMVAGLAVTAGDVRDEFTVMLTGLDVRITDGDPVSVTCASKDQDPTVARTPVEMDVDDEHAEELPRLL